MWGVANLNKLESEQGVTIFDMLATISLILILSGTALLQISDIHGSFDRAEARSRLVQDLRRIQAESIKQGVRGIMTVAADGKSYSFGYDYLDYDIVYPPAADTTSFVRNLPKNVTLAVDSAVIFDSRGRIIDIDGILDTRTITMTQTTGEGTEVIASGTISATGVLSYD